VYLSAPLDYRSIMGPQFLGNLPYFTHNLKRLTYLRKQLGNFVKSTSTSPFYLNKTILAQLSSLDICLQQYQQLSFGADFALISFEGGGLNETIIVQAVL